MSDSDEPPESLALRILPPASPANLVDQIRRAILSALVLTLLTGCAFPLLLAMIGRPLFPRQASGSLVTKGGVVIGSERIGQAFSRPEYFQPRPSAAGSGYDGASSGGTNLGPNNRKLRDGAADFAGIAQLAREYRQRNGVAPGTPIPIDAVTRSASGLDPDITPANAALQVPRVARARGVSQETVRRLVANCTKGPQLGFLGNARVPILEVNLVLDRSLGQGVWSTPR
jgi:K+-transporting ATPase ATPase C chain